MGGSVAGGAFVGGGVTGTSVGASVGASDGGADGTSVGHRTVITPPPEADGLGVGSSNDGMTPLASGVGPGTQVVCGDGAAQP